MGESMEVDMDVGDWLDSLLPSAHSTLRYRIRCSIACHTAQLRCSVNQYFLPTWLSCSVTLNELGVVV